MPTWNEMMYWDCPSCGRERIEGVVDSCPSCGAAHDTSEAGWYAEGAGDIRNRITDDADNRKAEAGPNWSCAYCQGTQRRPDGNCLNCGASQDSGADEPSGHLVNEPVSEPVPDRVVPAYEPYRDDAYVYRGSRFSGLRAFVVLVMILGVLWLLFHRTPVELEVTDVSWSHQVHVDRTMLVTEQGFNEDMPRQNKGAKVSGEPNIAFAVELEDPSRYHHTDQVPDGFTTEHYTVQVACGQVMSGRTPVNCYANGNGTRTCTGGDPVYTTKYCPESRTRQIPRYRDVRRYARWYSWKVWRWKPNRVVRHDGETTSTTWPDSKEVCLGCGVSQPVKERERARRSFYTVNLKGVETDDVRELKPKQLSDFTRFTPGSRHVCTKAIVGRLRCPEDAAE